MRFWRSVLARFRAWRAWETGRRRGRTVEPSLVLSFAPAIYRDVTPAGVRVYSLCGSCGARLQCSATLCEECAQGPRTSAL